MKRFLLIALTAALLFPAVSSFGAGYADGALIAKDTGALQLDNLKSVAGDGLSVSGGVFFVLLGDGLSFTGGVVTISFGDGLSITGNVLTATAVGGGNPIDSRDVTNNVNYAGFSSTNAGTNQMEGLQLGTNTPITGQVIRTFLTNNQDGVNFTAPLTVDSSPVLTEASETNLIVMTWTSIGNLTGASSFDGLRVLPSDAEIISFWAVTDDAGTAGNTISISLNFADIAASDETLQTNGWSLAEVTDPTSRLDVEGNGQDTARVLYTNSLFSVTNFSLGDVFSVDIEDSGAQASDLVVQAVFRKN